ncbi:MAG: hypothetical protein AB1646_06010 [Thermodesulfobacteriota bacterium]
MNKEVSPRRLSCKQQTDERFAISGQGGGFEWKTRLGLFGIPLICVSFGRDHRGRARIATGFVAIGRYAVGGIAIGQVGVGVISLGQLALGIGAFGQLAAGALVGFGQLAMGTYAVGQIVAGVYGRGQMGWATYLWSPARTDMEAVAMFGHVEWLVKQDLATILDTLLFELKITLDSVKSLFR